MALKSESGLRALQPAHPGQALNTAVTKEDSSYVRKMSNGKVK